MILTKQFFNRDTISLAKNLLGTYLVHQSPDGKTVGKIVEVEAYLGKNDPASHSFKGETAANRVMFGAPGKAYIYLIYGMYLCLNVSSAPSGVGEGVLIRALEPIRGIDLMKIRRGTDDSHKLCSGPGKLVKAMGITKYLAGHDLTLPPLYLTISGNRIKPSITTTKRVGLSIAQELPLRFYLKNNQYISQT